MRPVEPILTADLFPDLLEALLELLSGLSDEEWQEPTKCAGWSVKDVALHLLGGELGNLSRRRDGHSLGGSITSWEELVAYINNWNLEWVRSARRLSPPLLIDLLRHAGAQMNAYFQSLDPYALGAPVSWAGPQPAPVWLDVAREYTERWHHQQHIRDAVRQPGMKEPRFFAPVLAAFARALPYTFREVDAPQGATVVMTLTGEAGGRWTIVRQGDDWTLYDGAADQPDAEARIDQEIAWRLFTRGMSPRDSLPRVSLKGQRALCLHVLEMVSIIA